MSEALPVVDLQATPADAAAVLRDACCSHGFFYVVNHGVDQETIAALLREVTNFFALPLAHKMAILTDGNNRGYTPFQEETLDPATQSEGDTKEGLYFGRDVPLDNPEACKPLHGPNQWPDPAVLPMFRPSVEKYFSALARLGHRLLRIVARSLELPETWFDDKFDAPMTVLRPLHYSPRLSDAAAGVYGAGAHSDYGMLTLLMTDGTPGLQILQGQSWMPVDPLPGAFVVNIGDMLERFLSLTFSQPDPHLSHHDRVRWTNGRYKSTLHRVLSESGRDRYSCPFFFEPNFDATVQCIPTCCTVEAPRYPPITAGQHLLQKYNATHALFDSEARAA